MEKRLTEYRALRKRQVFVNGTKEKLKNMFSWESSKTDANSKEDKLVSIEPREAEKLSENVDADSDSGSSETTTCHLPQKKEWIDYVLYVLYFIFWVTVYALFIKFGFGTVYILLSALIGICLNTRTRPKVPGEVSAYSVFNKDCEAIDGTLKAEQFEREIRYGSSSV